MKKLQKTGLTLVQIALGAVLGLLGGMVIYFLLNNLIWNQFLAKFIDNGLIASIFTLIFFAAIYGFAVVCTGESIRFIESLKGKVTVPRTDIYRGAFMGAPAIIALLSITNIDWGSMSGIIFPLNILFGIVYAIVFVLTVPIKIIIRVIPTEVVYVIAAPIGAIIGYKISEFNKEVEEQES